jgi:hypothetical protein
MKLNVNTKVSVRWKAAATISNHIKVKSELILIFVKKKNKYFWMWSIFSFLSCP